MGGMLWHLRQRAHERLVAGLDSAPTKAPEVAPAEKATLMVANDDDNSLLPQVHSLAPARRSRRPRPRRAGQACSDLYAAPNAAHPVPGGAASVAQVFLLPVLPQRGRGSASPQDERFADSIAGRNWRWSI